MGESVNEAATEARNVILGTIKESDLINVSNAWSQKEESRHEAASRSFTEWPVNKKDTHFKQPSGIKRNRSTAISNIELRRRNSDPATKVSGLGDDKVNLESNQNDLKQPTPVKNSLQWKGNLFILSGHKFRKIARFSKDDVCVCCNEKMDAFVTQVSY